MENRVLEEPRAKTKKLNLYLIYFLSDLSPLVLGLPTSVKTVSVLNTFREQTFREPLEFYEPRRPLKGRRRPSPRYLSRPSLRGRTPLARPLRAERGGGGAAQDAAPFGRPPARRNWARCGPSRTPSAPPALPLVRPLPLVPCKDWNMTLLCIRR